MTRPILVFGDHLARQDRDPLGLPARLELAQRRVVMGYGVNGGIRRAHEAAEAVLGPVLLMDAGTPGRPDRGDALILVGMTDAKGGGPPPRDFAFQVVRLASLCVQAGLPPSVVTTTPCPASAGRLPGYAKGARRWQRRMLPVLVDALMEAGVPHSAAVLPDEDWIDSLTLRTPGLHQLLGAARWGLESEDARRGA